ncbi:MAG: hypothetical protein DRR42_21065 [Gammaproteobacteria bacterium]|nr:MAG: hypothetical protein DRR42_21065 [Gammaproteobacteria bacterium]
MPNNKTKAAYRKRAQHFYTSRIEGAPTPKKIKGALLNAAADYRPDYWRQLRNAICQDQKEKGYTETANAISQIKNPLTTSSPIDKQKIPKKQPRSKRIKLDEITRVFLEFKKKRDPLLESALTLATILGCRPAEMEKILVQSNQDILIVSAKKRTNDDRGLDRLLKLDQMQTKMVLNALNKLDLETQQIRNKGMKSSLPHLLERRLSTLTHRIWPRRKCRPTFYSFRHQLASDLKRSGYSRELIAYIMGHRSTISATVYGSWQSGSTRGIEAGISESEIRCLVKSNHLKVPKTAPILALHESPHPPSQPAP